MMRIQILYFASIREALELAEEPFECAQETTVSQVRVALIARGGIYAEVLGLARPVKTALNQSMCGPDSVLTQGCELAFFPPVTGG
jgi:molybdopterin synthase sulfur carrier subunit